MNGRTYIFPRVVRYIIFLSITYLGVAHIDTVFVHAADPPAVPLLRQENLNYVGSFKMPKYDQGDSKFTWGSGRVAYHSLNNSLYMVGHKSQQMVAEVAIPTPVVTTQEENLPFATVLQLFADPSEGKMYTVDDGTIKLGGLLVLNNKLYGTAYDYYDADGSQVLSHFSSSLNLFEQGDAQGMYQLDVEKAGRVSGYMGHIPPEWQESFGGPALTGNCCISIISRSSYGPAAFVFDPAQLGQQSPVPATPLVYYPGSDPLGDWDGTNPYYNGSTQMKGIVFPKGSRSVLFLGNHGVGPWCYGTGTECNDPLVSYKGGHAYPYVNQIWVYDALELLKVKNGEKEPWEVVPYEIWPITLPFPPTDYKSTIGGTYDPSTQRIYMTEHRSGETINVHVFSLNHDTSGSDTTPPALVQGVTVN